MKNNAYQAGNQVFLATALALLELGLSPVLLDGKKPIIPNFTAFDARPAHASEMEMLPERRPLRYSRELIEGWANAWPMANVGVLTRDMPAIDVDDESVWPLIADLVPPTPHVKRGARGWTFLYSQDVADPVMQSRCHVNRFSGAMVLEVLANGRQTVLPPSIHPDSGLPYQWVQSPWGPATPLGSVRPPALSQAQVDAIEARLREHNLIKQKKERSSVLTRLLREDERARYATWLAPKLAEKVSEVRKAVEGGRMNALNGAVFALARWVREGFIDEEWLQNTMREACGEHGNRWITTDGDKAFTRQYEKALDDGWGEPLSDLDAGRLEAMGAPPQLNPFVFDGTLPDEEPEFIDGILPATPGTLAFIAGQSQAGKTFAACRMAVSLAHGIEFLGKRVYERTGVVIIAAEGAGGYRTRLWAAAREAGVEKQALDIAIIPWNGNLLDVAQLTQLVEQVNQLPFRPGVMIVDTIAAAAAIEDGNSTAEVVAVCKVLRSVGERTGCVIVPVHHLGKDKAKGMVGSQAWFSSADTVMSCDADIDPLTGEVSGRRVAMTKTREGKTGPLGEVELKVVDIGPSRHFGKRRTTCVYALTTKPALPVVDKEQLTADELTRLREHLTVHGPRFKWGAVANPSFKPQLEMLLKRPLKRDCYERIMAKLEAAKVVQRIAVPDGKNAPYHVEIRNSSYQTQSEEKIISEA